MSLFKSSGQVVCKSKLCTFARNRWTVGCLRPWKTFHFFKKCTHKKEAESESLDSFAPSPYVPLWGTYEEAKKRDMLWELWEQKQFSPWDKQEASLRPAPFLLCSANKSIHDREEFNQQWSSPTVSINKKFRSNEFWQRQCVMGFDVFGAQMRRQSWYQQNR